MSEKIIHQITITETDDGYRIEIKGDKEKLRAMGFGRGFRAGSAPACFSEACAPALADAPAPTASAAIMAITGSTASMATTATLATGAPAAGEGAAGVRAGLSKQKASKSKKPPTRCSQG